MKLHYTKGVSATPPMNKKMNRIAELKQKLSKLDEILDGLRQESDELNKSAESRSQRKAANKLKSRIQRLEAEKKNVLSELNTLGVTITINEPAPVAEVPVAEPEPGVDETLEEPTEEPHKESARAAVEAEFKQAELEQEMEAQMIPDRASGTKPKKQQGLKQPNPPQGKGAKAGPPAKKPPKQRRPQNKDCKAQLVLQNGPKSTWQVSGGEGTLTITAQAAYGPVLNEPYTDNAGRPDPQYKTHLAAFCSPSYGRSLETECVHTGMAKVASAIGGQFKKAVMGGGKMMADEELLEAPMGDDMGGEMMEETITEEIPAEEPLEEEATPTDWIVAKDDGSFESVKVTADSPEAALAEGAKQLGIEGDVSGEPDDETGYPAAETDSGFVYVVGPAATPGTGTEEPVEEEPEEPEMEEPEILTETEPKKESARQTASRRMNKKAQTPEEDMMEENPEPETTGAPFEPTPEGVEQLEAEPEDKLGVTDVLIDILAPMIVNEAYSADDIMNELQETFSDDDMIGEFRGALEERVDFLSEEVTAEPEGEEDMESAELPTEAPLEEEIPPELVGEEQPALNPPRRTASLQQKVAQLEAENEKLRRMGAVRYQAHVASSLVTEMQAEGLLESAADFEEQGFDREAAVQKAHEHAKETATKFASLPEPEFNVVIPPLQNAVKRAQARRVVAVAETPPVPDDGLKVAMAAQMNDLPKDRKTELTVKEVVTPDFWSAKTYKRLKAEREQ